MRRFKDVLAVYGDQLGADDVLSHAVALAKDNDARLTVIEVLPERYATPSTLAERKKRLERLKPSIAAQGVDAVSVAVLSGTPFLQVIQKVIRDGHDLVIAGADGGLSLRRFAFGSTATHLMRKCPCPVWVVKPGHGQRYSNILACVDPARHDIENDRMNRQILDLASSLATHNGAGLHVVHAWEVEGKDRDTLASEARDEAKAAIMERHEAAHRNRVQELLADYDFSNLRHEVHLPNGAPQQAIVDLVGSRDIDLIVMGTVCRTGISGLIIGNAAETVLSVVECGVLTVKPDSFVSPVMLDQVRMTA